MDVSPFSKLWLKPFVLRKYLEMFLTLSHLNNKMFFIQPKMQGLDPPALIPRLNRHLAAKQGTIMTSQWIQALLQSTLAMELKNWSCFHSVKTVIGQEFMDSVREKLPVQHINITVCTVCTYGIYGINRFFFPKMLPKTLNTTLFCRICDPSCNLA